MIDDPIVKVEVDEEKGRALRVGIVCGGPSAERGISLNSARSVLDHIQVFNSFQLFRVVYSLYIC